MTPEQIRVRIAEACGWVRDDICDLWRKDGEAAYDDGRYNYRQLPNYPGDLNAMIEAFGTLGRHWEISQVCDGYYCRTQFGPKNKDVTVGGLELLPVMGEAFLRTLGIWEE